LGKGFAKAFIEAFAEGFAKGLANQEQEQEQEQEQKKGSSAALTRRETHPSNDPVSRIYEAYPRKIAKATALKAINKAITNLAKQNDCSSENAENLIYEAVVKFAGSPAGQKGEYTPHCATWMNAGRYLDDPSEWHNLNAANGNRNGNKGKELTDGNLEALNVAFPLDR